MTEKIELSEPIRTPEDLQAFRNLVSDAAINANTEPASLTPEEHKDIILLQRFAAMLTNKANSTLE